MYYSSVYVTSLPFLCRADTQQNSFGPVTPENQRVSNLSHPVVRRNRNEFPLFLFSLEGLSTYIAYESVSLYSLSLSSYVARMRTAPFNFTIGASRSIFLARLSRTSK